MFLANVEHTKVDSCEDDEEEEYQGYYTRDESESEASSKEDIPELHSLTKSSRPA